ncbi:kinase-like protein [Dendrothele bispora CBS 962.96]|uniref:Kinase-like protein n=1 Tax=Dendrothele bispora (strain CBS 962.96) TaxID=1314807 RepID=A0A4S8MM07_DENBC|nr:kinase-like protein [Dendrothele bispora CBS 962.96]
MPQVGVVFADRIHVIEDHFIHAGPNGSHVCLVSQFAGPSLLDMHQCLDRTSGSRKVAKQVSEAVKMLHSSGILHGDLSSSNILFKMSRSASQWSDFWAAPKYIKFPLRTLDPPFGVVAPVDSECLLSFIQEDVLLINCGQAVFSKCLLTDYQPAILLHYLSPEGLFGAEIGLPSNIWALACILFEIRTGAPIFDSFFYGHNFIVKQIVELGKLPEVWWASWNDRTDWFNVTGHPLPDEEQIRNGIIFAVKSTLQQKLVSLLEELLGKMLKYDPDEWLSIEEVVEHRWFLYSDC